MFLCTSSGLHSGYSSIRHRLARRATPRCAQARPHAAAFAESVHRVLASIPVVEWFVRSPPPEDADAASATPRRRRNLLS